MREVSLSHDKPLPDQARRRISLSPDALRPRVLIVDDHADTRDMYAWCMRAAGWLVQTASDGEEALQLAPAFEPQVIVMDLAMPVLDGLETTRRLKLREHTRGIPVVALTATTRSGAEVEAAGCHSFLTKPLAPQELLRVLEYVVLDGGMAPT